MYFLNTNTNTYILAGITSFTNAAGCGLTGPQKFVTNEFISNLKLAFSIYFNSNIVLKSGFTRVSNYLSWISSQTFSSRVLLSNEVDESPVKVKPIDPMSDLNNMPKSYEVTIDVHQDNQTNN